MADLEHIVPANDRSLKYLDFGETVVIYVMVCFWGLYQFAKGNAGPLKPGVQAVEDSVRAVFGPVGDKLWHVPFDFIRFADQKVDEYVCEVERHVPSLVKHFPGHVRAVASEISCARAVAAAKAVARATYDRYETVAEKYAVAGWVYLNRMPVVSEVAQIAVPTAAYWADCYNQCVALGSERGYAVTSYLPLIPSVKIERIFQKEIDNGPMASINDGDGIQAQ